MCLSAIYVNKTDGWLNTWLSLKGLGWEVRIMMILIERWKDISSLLSKRMKRVPLTTINGLNCSLLDLYSLHHILKKLPVRTEKFNLKVKWNKKSMYLILVNIKQKK